MKQALELLDELDLSLKDSTIEFVGEEFLKNGLERGKFSDFVCSRAEVEKANSMFRLLELKEGERFPIDYYKPLQTLWVRSI